MSPIVEELDSEHQHVLLGNDAVEQLPGELEGRGAERVLVVASRTLAKETPLVDRVRKLLGERALPDHATIRGHTPEEDVEHAVELARRGDADGIVSLGGGGVVDGAKHVVHRVTDELEEPPLVHVAVPTTLSGAEFTHLAGITVDDVKTGVADMRLIPHTALLDPTVAEHTPRELWAWTGVRAVDTAIEGFLQAEDVPVAERCLQGLETLVPALVRSQRDASDHDAAAACYRGTWLASIGTMEADAARGPSHVLGKALGATYGIQHGLTSALTLPLVLDWWAERDPGGVERVAQAFHPDAGADDAAGLLKDWLDELGIQRRPLRELGVPEKAVDEIEENLLGPVDESLVERVSELW